MQILRGPLLQLLEQPFSAGPRLRRTLVALNGLNGLQTILLGILLVGGM